MGCFADFFKGYKQTPRQECKIRASQPRLSTNPSNEEYWKNRDDYEGVPSVSFSFGQTNEKEHHEGMPTEMSREGSPDGYGFNGYNNQQAPNGSDAYYGNNHQGMPTFDDNGSSISRKSLSNSSQSYSQSRSRSHLEKGRSQPATEERSASLPNSESAGEHKEGDLEWMYQLNTLAKEHAQRSKGAEGKAL